VWDGVAKYIFNTVARVTPRVHTKLHPIWYYQIL